jgi:hypothetical protein
MILIYLSKNKKILNYNNIFLFKKKILTKKKNIEIIWNSLNMKIFN